MRISFITPSPGTLKREWYGVLHYQKVGVPNLAGWLRRAGFSDIRQYDFNNQALRAYARRPGSVNLMLYGEQAAAARGPVIRAQTEALLNLLKVRKSDLFALSLTCFLGDELEIRLGIRLSQCLAAALKERFPSCVIVIGGLQNMTTDFQRAEYESMLKDCPALDYAICGDAHRAMLELCRAVEEGREPAAAGPLVIRKIKGARLLYETKPGGKTPAISRYFEPLPAGELRDPSVPPGFPAYDKANSRAYSYTAARIRDFYRLPPACRARLKGPAEKENYLLLQVSFNDGCPFNCYFCNQAGTGVFSLSAKESVDTLRRLKDSLGCRHFLFYNPNFNPTAAYAKNLLREIIKAKLDILWADCFNLRNIDGEMIDLMKEAGVVKVVTGVEYPTGRMLKYINKGLSPGKIYASLEALHKAGIWNHVLLITGLPTETWDDVRELEAWLKATDPFVDAYTVGSFHMAQNSPFQKNPEKFGFSLGSPIRMYAQSEFGEKRGLSWKRKALQNERTNRHVVDFIDRMKGSLKHTSTRMEDSHLLMYLYRSLGHGRKDLIREIYREAGTENPHLAGAHAALLRRLKAPGSALNALLRGGGVRLSEISRTPEDLGFSLEKDGLAARCTIRARHEGVLLNPAGNRIHGGQFMLHSDFAGPALLKDRALAGLARKAGASLYCDQPDSCAPGRTGLTLRLAGGSVHFSVDLAASPPGVTARPVAGPVLSHATLDSLERLVAAAALSAKKEAAAGAKTIAGIIALLPRLLRIIESWDVKMRT